LRGGDGDYEPACDREEGKSKTDGSIDAPVVTLESLTSLGEGRKVACLKRGGTGKKEKERGGKRKKGQKLG